MHSALLRLVLGSCLLLSVACASSVTTEPPDLAPLPSQAPGLRLERAAVTDLDHSPSSVTSTDDVSGDRQLYEALKRLGGGQIGDDPDAPLVLADVRLASDVIESNAGMPLLQIFVPIPPLAFIPLDFVRQYQVEYAVDDAAGREVATATVEGELGGWYAGWWWGSAFAMGAVATGVYDGIPEHAAHLVLNDLRSRDLALRRAADHYRRNPQLAEAERAAVERKRKRRHEGLASLVAANPYRWGQKKRWLGDDFVAPAGYQPPAATALAAPASAVRPAPRPTASRTPAAVLRPQGGSTVQDEILFNTMKAAVSERHRVVAGPELEAAVAGCGDAACRLAAAAKLGAQRVFRLVVLREEGGAQVVVEMEHGSQGQSRSDYCSACATPELDATVARLAGELQQATRPAPLPAALAPAAAAPAARPASNSVTDAVQRCLAKKAAMQACSAVPSFGKIACRAAARAKFGTDVCP